MWFVAMEKNHFGSDFVFRKLMGGSEMGIKGIMGKMCLKWSKGALRTIFYV